LKPEGPVSIPPVQLQHLVLDLGEG